MKNYTVTLFNGETYHIKAMGYRLPDRTPSSVIHESMISTTFYDKDGDVAVFHKDVATILVDQNCTLDLRTCDEN